MEWYAKSQNSLKHKALYDKYRKESFERMCQRSVGKHKIYQKNNTKKYAKLGCEAELDEYSNITKMAMIRTKHYFQNLVTASPISLPSSSCSQSLHRDSYIHFASSLTDNWQHAYPHWDSDSSVLHAQQQQLRTLLIMCRLVSCN